LQPVHTAKASMNRFASTILAIILLLLGHSCLQAQQILPPPTGGTDTLRTINIMQGRSMRMMQLDSVTTVETIAGGVVMKEGNTTFYCDSAVVNRRTNIMEAFGNIHINDSDSIHTYAQYLRYVGSERMAYLKKKVQLTDKKGVLYTEELQYDLGTHIGRYANGGKIVNGKTTLTSQEGVYYADTRDVYFKQTVHLVDAKYDMRSDSLLYNTQTQIATFIAPTRIVSKEGIIETRSGTYNLKTGEAAFFDRTTFKDSTHSAIADKMIFEEKTGILLMEGRAKFVDSANKVIMLGNNLEFNKKENSFLGYGKPVMILYDKTDSTYIAADTLFSGIRKAETDSLQQKTGKKEKLKGEKIERPTAVNVSDTVSTRIAADTLLSDIRKAEADTLQKKAGKKEKLKGEKIERPTAVNAADTAIRYFLAFHHVRIFNDSLQSVCDSLYYSSEDSTFRLFNDPVVWNDKTQLKGDTIYLFTKNKKPERIYVFNSGMVINKANDLMYNQIGGRTINGYFKDGDIDYMRIKGSPAESIYYPQDDDSAYVGMNRSSGDEIDIFFANKELKKVKFVNDVNGTMYPIKKTPEDQKKLKGFEWLDKRRPKNKLELFE
jgi:lipopolysaccharide export system protein LptA